VDALARQMPVLKSGQDSWRDYKRGRDITAPNASFVVGNKAVVFRKPRYKSDYNIYIMIDNKERGSLSFWGSLGNGNFGYPFRLMDGEPPVLSVDETSQTATLTKSYLTKDGKKATYTCRLRTLGESRIEISWNSGSSHAISAWVNLKEHYRTNEVQIGSSLYRPASRETLLEKKRIVTPHVGNLVYNTSTPAKGYVVEFASPKSHVEEVLRQHPKSPDIYGISIRQRGGATGSLVIDLGEAALASKDAPPAVGGIDFYKRDGTHVPVSPVRNLFRNPSFNRGLHYWRWTGGGAYYEPSKELRYSVVPEGKFGRNALAINPYQRRSAAIKSLPIALEKGETYTLSLYAKSDSGARTLTMALASAGGPGGKFRGRYGTVFGDSDKPEARIKIGPTWARYSRTFVADDKGIQLLLGTWDDCRILVDGIQLEKGAKASEFATAPLEGVLKTSDPDNDIFRGMPINGRFAVYGKPGTKGRIKVTVNTIFREVVDAYELSVVIPDSGEQVVDLPVSEQKIGEGVFVVRADYSVDGFPAYTDYRRLTIMTPLKNTHATKNIFGNLLGGMKRISRGGDLARKYMEWGFGSTSWGVNYNHLAQTVYAGMQKQYNIENLFTTTKFNRGSGKQYEKYYELNNYRRWKEEQLTPEFIDRMAALAEEAAYEKVKAYDSKQFNTWCFGNEEESSVLANRPDDYMKIIAGAQRGAKRADPTIQFFMTCGTSGYSKLRGFEPMEKYFKAAEKIGLRFDAVTTHPYGSIDGGWMSRGDLDETTALLIDQMKRYGYGKETPIYYTECFNNTDVWIPEWNTVNNDRYQNGKVSYDFGNRELIHAVSAARHCIITLKYWPHVQSNNIWVHKPYVDCHLTPLILNKVVNTLGHHLPDVEYQADVKPNAKVRGYVFKLKDGSAVAPLWCVDRDVEQGLVRGPTVKIRFAQPVQFYDIMGNPREARVGQDGYTQIRLTPAPLLIKAKNVAKLNAALQDIQTDDTRANYVLRFEPSLSGEVKANLKNMTNRPQTGKLEVGKTQIDYAIASEGQSLLTIPGEKVTPEFSKLFRWNREYVLDPRSGTPVRDAWKMDYFYVPKVKGTPDWKHIPAMKITNRFFSTKMKQKIAKGFKPPTNDLKASYKLAWNEQNLYLRVEAEDDDFVVTTDDWKRPNSQTQLYKHDGCLEVYFDTGANGRNKKEYDDDDYRYDFSIGKTGKSGAGMVYRFREVDHQLADGVNMASKKEAAEKIRCEFAVTEKGYAYTITFALRYIEPIALRKGFVAGLGLYLHDKESGESWPSKALTTSTMAGKHCDYNPHFWPLMILAE
jgi:hypothetical protein